MKSDGRHDLDGSWVVSSIEAGGDRRPSAPEVTTSLTLRDGEASGNAGVNRFGAVYTLGPEGEMSFGPIASTRMAGPAAAMAQEAQFFTALEATRRFDLADEQLVLREMDGTPLVVLTPASPD